MRSARLVTPITLPLPIQPLLKAATTSGAACCIAPWNQLDLLGTPKSGGISAGAISSGLGAARPLAPITAEVLRLVASPRVDRRVNGSSRQSFAREPAPATASTAGAGWIPSRPAAFFAAPAVPNGLIQDCRRARAGIAQPHFPPWRVQPCRDGRSRWGNRSSAQGSVSRS